jgi:hypothetical protein
MGDKAYSINKGINKAIEFKGLKAQYIGYVVGVILGSMLVYGVMYVCGLSSYICVPVTLGLGGAGIAWVLRMSKKFGQYGMMKWRAKRGVPKALVSRSRKLFIEIRVKDGNRVG